MAKAGLNDNYVYQKLNITRGHFYKIKSGKQRLNIDQIRQLSEIFKCDKSEITDAALEESTIKLSPNTEAECLKWCMEIIVNMMDDLGIELPPTIALSDAMTLYQTAKRTVVKRVSNPGEVKE